MFFHHETPPINSGLRGIGRQHGAIQLAPAQCLEIFPGPYWSSRGNKLIILYVYIYMHIIVEWYYTELRCNRRKFRSQTSDNKWYGQMEKQSISSASWRVSSDRLKFFAAQHRSDWQCRRLPMSVATWHTGLITRTVGESNRLCLFWLVHFPAA